jgi:hypothetical protein
VTGLSTLVAVPGLRSLSAVTRDVTALSTVEALLLSGAVTAHVADTAAGVAGALLLSTVRSSAVAAAVSVSSTVLRAVTRDVSNLVALQNSRALSESITNLATGRGLPCSKHGLLHRIHPVHQRSGGSRGKCGRSGCTMNRMMSV